jgi:hypothetical protein
LKQLNLNISDEFNIAALYLNGNSYLEKGLSYSLDMYKLFIPLQVSQYASDLYLIKNDGYINIKYVESQNIFEFKYPFNQYDDYNQRSLTATPGFKFISIHEFDEIFDHGFWFWSKKYGTLIQKLDVHITNKQEIKIFFDMKSFLNEPDLFTHETLTYSYEDGFMIISTPGKSKRVKIQIDSIWYRFNCDGWGNPVNTIMNSETYFNDGFNGSLIIDGLYGIHGVLNNKRLKSVTIIVDGEDVFFYIYEMHDIKSVKLASLKCNELNMEFT